MQERSKDLFLEVMNQVLEQFAFVFVEEEVTAPDLTGESSPVWAEVRFSGSGRAGSVALAAPGSLCREIAKNTLGEEGEDSLPPNAESVALQEVANILCGNLLARMYGTEEPFTLHPPRGEIISGGDWWKMSASEDTAAVIVEGEPVLARFSETETG